MAKTIKIKGEGHTIKKNKKGDVIVSHPNGGGPTMDLTKKDAKIKTVKDGIAAGRQWHKTHKKGK